MDYSCFKPSSEPASYLERRIILGASCYTSQKGIGSRVLIDIFYQYPQSRLNPSLETWEQLHVLGVGKNQKGQEKLFGTWLFFERIFFSPILTLPAPTNCPWVSEDGHDQDLIGILIDTWSTLDSQLSVDMHRLKISWMNVNQGVDGVSIK